MRFPRLAAVAAILAAGCASSGGKEPALKPAPSQEEMMGKMMELAQPGAPHARFARMVGEWESDGKMWMLPGTPPMEMKGVSKMRLILGGRYLVDEYQSDFMGMPFQGAGIYGYDNLRKEHTAIWMDSFSTFWMEMRGTADETGKVITQVGTMPDPFGNTWGMRMVSREIDDDHFMFEAWNIPPRDVAAPKELPPGTPWGEFKCMEMRYTRKK